MHLSSFLKLSLALATFPIAAAALHAQMPTPASLAAEINQKGAKEVVARLNRTPQNGKHFNDWDRLTHMIWIGRPDYIALALRLAPGTDAGTSEDLGISLAHALPLAPAGVLKVTDIDDGPTLGVSRICGVPFIEGTVDDIPAYIRKARAAVQSVSAPELQSVKSICLKKLDIPATPAPR